MKGTITMNDENVSSEVAVATEVVVSPEATVTPVVEKVKRNSPSSVDFVNIVNASSDRKDALNRFAAAGFNVTYSAFTARYNAYHKATPKINIKALPNLPKGRRLDVAALNAATAPVVEEVPAV
jgi:hypothetical protein